MVRQVKHIVVLMALLVIITGALIRTSPPRGESFTGICVYSSGDFSVLFNGTHRVAVQKTLEIGKTYRAVGRLRKGSRGLWMDTYSIEPAEPDFPLESMKGAYWVDGHPYLLTPDRLHLSTFINASKGEIVLAYGVKSGRKFYPIKIRRLGFLKAPREGLPFAVEGVVLSRGRYITVWNGSDEFKVLRLKGVEPSPGQRIRVVGIVRIRDSIYLYPSSSGDVEILGYPAPVGLGNSSTGDVVEAECTVIASSKTSLKMNCTSLRLYGFKARVGDVLHIRALRRKSSLLCLNCSVVRPREELPNTICEHSPGAFGRISGTLSWVRRYRNGFGIANVTKGNCWVLLKLPKSLGVSPVPGENITAYGFFTTYRGEPAFEVRSREDLCSENSC
jgi:hypothetical protein